jgi:hypothetical protein
MLSGRLNVRAIDGQATPMTLSVRPRTTKP